MKIGKVIICTLSFLITPLASGHAQLSTPKTLDMKQEKLITIASFTAKGDLYKLKVQLNEGLDAGLTVNQVKEIIVHTYAYCGFPRAIRALQTLMAVLDERRAEGITDEWGPEASPITDTRDKYERGKDILAQLAGTPPPSRRPTRGYAAFCPEIETFLKEHLFADIFERDVLTFSQREMVTVSVLINIGRVEPMMRSHMNLTLNTGITPEQLKEMIRVIRLNVGNPEADEATEVLNELLKSKGLT